MFSGLHLISKLLLEVGLYLTKSFCIIMIISIDEIGVFPPCNIQNVGWRKWTTEIETFANASGDNFLYAVLTEKIRAGIVIVI